MVSEVGDVNRVAGGFTVGDRTKEPEQGLGDEERDEEAFRAKLASIAKANREAAGLSPAEAARRAHISRAAVRDVEGRKSWPRVDTLVAYARAIGTTPWSLLRLAHSETDGEAEAGAPSEQPAFEPAPVPVDLNAILLRAGATEHTWKTARALLEALVLAHDRHEADDQPG